MSDPVWPHRRQPTRLPRPWDSQGKNTGVGYHFLLQCMKVKRESEVAQSCPTRSDPKDCSLPGSSVHGIFQARVLEWGAIAFFSTGHRLHYKDNSARCTILCWQHFAFSRLKCFAFQYVRNVIFWLMLFLTRNYYTIFSDFLPGHRSHFLASPLV